MPYNKKRAATKMDKKMREIAKDVSKGLAEKKYHENAFIALPDNSFLGSNQLISVSTIPQGTTDSNRVGDSLRPYSLELNCVVAQNATPALQTIRVIVFQWHANNSEDPPVFSGVVADDNVLMPSVFGTTPYPQSPYQHDKKNFRVLMDRQCVIAFGGESMCQIRKKINLSSLGRMRYNAAGTSGTNHIYIATIGSEPTSVGNPASATFYTRLLYTDT